MYPAHGCTPCMDRGHGCTHPAHGCTPITWLHIVNAQLQIPCMGRGHGCTHFAHCTSPMRKGPSAAHTAWSAELQHAALLVTKSVPCTHRAPRTRCHKQWHGHRDQRLQPHTADGAGGLGAGPAVPGPVSPAGAGLCHQQCQDLCYQQDHVTSHTGAVLPGCPCQCPPLTPPALWPGHSLLPAALAAAAPLHPASAAGPAAGAAPPATCCRDSRDTVTMVTQEAVGLQWGCGTVVGL